jgi:hypothetical protein
MPDFDPARQRQGQVMGVCATQDRVGIIPERVPRALLLAFNGGNRDAVNLPDERSVFQAILKDVLAVEDSVQIVIHPVQHHAPGHFK